jgi:signal transduction histidine kinase
MIVSVLGVLVALIEMRWAPSGAPVGTVVADGLVGWLALAAAVTATARRPDSLIGLLCAICGLTWLLGTVVGMLAYVHRGAVIQLALGTRSGRLRGWPDRAVVAFGYLTCPPAIATNERVQLVLAAAVLVAGMGWGRPVGVGRMQRLRSRLLASGTYACALAFAALNRLTLGHADVAALIVYDAAVVVVIVLALIDVLSAGAERVGLTELVVALGERDRPSTVAAVLRAAVGDRDLVVGYWLDSRGSYVGDTGEAVPIRPTGGQVLTKVSGPDGAAAVVVHRRDVLDDPRLVDSVSAVLRLAAANVRARDAAQRRLLDLDDSRRRLVEAVARERERISAELRGQVMPWIQESSALVERLATQSETSAVDEMRDDLVTVAADLRVIARGLHPDQLADSGLAVALRLLPPVAGSATEIRTSAHRLPPGVEECAYFICLEAMANIGKHARAQRAWIDLEVLDGWLEVVVEDDGVGGADPHGGSGLRRLADRARAAGGRLEVTDRPAGGTRLRALLPMMSGQNSRTAPSPAYS